MLLSPAEVYNLVRITIPKISGKYPVADPRQFARMMVSLCFQESCTAKNAKGWRCFDTDAAAASSSALGLTQVLKDTQRWIEQTMGWEKRPLDDRRNPEYSMALGAAYIGYLLKRNGGDWFKTFSAYHDGHYKAGAPGNDYARTVQKHYAMFPWASIEAEADSELIEMGAQFGWGLEAVAKAITQVWGEFY